MGFVGSTSLFPAFRKVRLCNHFSNTRLSVSHSPVHPHPTRLSQNRLRDGLPRYTRGTSRKRKKTGLDQSAQQTGKTELRSLDCRFFFLPCFSEKRRWLSRSKLSRSLVVRTGGAKSTQAGHSRKQKPSPATAFVGEMVSPACQKSALSAVFASPATANDAGPRMLVRMHD